MGKKSFSQSSPPTISKHEEDHKKQQLNSLIKILKPKVYITDSSSFKALVQQLTGNDNDIGRTRKSNNHTTISSSPRRRHRHHQIISQQRQQQQEQEEPIVLMDHHHVPAAAPVIMTDQLESHQSYSVSYQESSRELSVDSSERNFPMPAFSGWEDGNNLLPEFTVMTSFPSYSESSFLATHQTDIESWLFETGDSFNYDELLLPASQPGVCVYDYDLSGLI